MNLPQEIQFFSWIAAAAGAIVTAVLAIINFRNSIRERRLDLRWKMANAARVFVQETHSDKRANDAISILDWLDMDRGAETESEHVKRSELVRIMNAPADHTFSHREHYVLQCFDWLFYYIDRMEQNIQDGLFPFDSVKYIFLSYYETVARDRGTFDKFAADRRYLLAPEFWKRFDTDDFWKMSASDLLPSASIVPGSTSVPHG